MRKESTALRQLVYIESSTIAIAKKDAFKKRVDLLSCLSLPFTLLLAL